MKRNIIIAAVVIAIVGIGAFLLINNNSDDNSETPPASTDNSAQTETDNATPEDTTDTGDQASTAAITITYGDSGFSPSSYTIAAGGTVTVQNNSESVLNFASDDHPTHTKETELNIGEIQPGENKTFTPTKTGTWGFHNHPNPSDTGTITVE